MKLVVNPDAALAGTFAALDALGRAESFGKPARAHVKFENGSVAETVISPIYDQMMKAKGELEKLIHLLLAEQNKVGE